MKWVTWKNVGVDRMACAWFIRKWIDPKAEFLFIPEGSTDFPKSAEPFDIPGVRFSHHKCHCSLHALLRHHKIKDQVLDRIARIVDEADTVQEVLLEPIATGLDRLCHGLRLTSPDDRTALERGMMIYDALYAELKSEEQP
jgi:hypothetical protein